MAHRDYTSNGSVQVMLFSERLKDWNPGTLPPSLTLEKLRHPHGSVPGNPLLAEPLYLTKYIERMGTGTGDMIERCKNAGLAEPEFSLTDGFVITIRRKPGRAFEAVGGQVAGEVAEPVAREVTREVTGEVRKLVLVCRDAMTRRNLQESLLLRGEENFRIEKGEPTKEIWFYEHRVPEGQKAYSMTKPIKVEHLKPCADWWGGAKRKGRVENEVAWRVTAEEVKARGYNLDFKNPHTVADDHGDPEELLAKLDEAEKEAAALRDQLKAVLTEALLR